MELLDIVELTEHAFKLPANISSGQKQRLVEKQGPPVLTINCWNEWTEGSYLEPDTRNEMAYVEAVKRVLGHNYS